MSNNLIILSFGEGGHEEQAKRILESLKFKLTRDCKSFPMILSIYDKADLPKFAVDDVFHVNSLRDKHTNKLNIISSTLSLFSFIKLLNKYKHEYNIKGFISTGPGNCLIPALVCRLFKIKVIHIETWSRFYSKSFTGKFMYYLSDLFIVQNSELLPLYPKAVYGGRL